jgi:hypothetical protein
MECDFSTNDPHASSDILVLAGLGAAEVLGRKLGGSGMAGVQQDSVRARWWGTGVAKTVPTQPAPLLFIVPVPTLIVPLLLPLQPLLLPYPMLSVL